MMRKRKADKLEIRLAKLRAMYQELVLCDKLTAYIRTEERQRLAGKIAAIEERLQTARGDMVEDQEVKAALAAMFAQGSSVDTRR